METLIDAIWGADDMFTTVNPEIPFELRCTVFYTGNRNQDKEWSFFIILN